MKKILLPVEMRAEDDSATRYAVSFARGFGASITLCHTFQLPVPPSEAPVLMMPVEDIREQSQEALNKYMLKLKAEYPDVSFDHVTRVGDVEHGVAEIASEIDPDLIIMGLSENDVGHFIFGHNASGVVNHTNVPVLMLPPGLEYRPIRKVVVACDLHKLSGKDTLKPLHKLLRILNPELAIVHVVEDESELPSVSEAIAGLHLDQLFSGFKHSFHFPVNEDVVLGINEFARGSNADMVAIVHHPRGFLKRMFSKVHTRQMSFSTNVPLLVLHG